MNAALLEPLIETQEPSVSCTNCPAVLRLERALEQLQRDFRREVGYWKSQHAKAVGRIEQLKEELDQSRGQVRALQDKLLGRKSEKSAGRNRSNTLFDPEDVASAYKAMTQVKSGLLVLAFCWAHVRRDFVGVGKSWSELYLTRLGLSAIFRGRKKSDNSDH